MCGEGFTLRGFTLKGKQGERSKKEDYVKRD